MENLKNLTPEQCVQIANIVKPSKDWKYFKDVENSWNGHDVVIKHNDTLTDVIQISFSGEINYFDEGLNKYPINKEILNHLEKY